MRRMPRPSERAHERCAPTGCVTSRVGDEVQICAIEVARGRDHARDRHPRSSGGEERGGILWSGGTPARTEPTSEADARQEIEPNCGLTKSYKGNTVASILIARLGDSEICEVKNLL